MGISGGPLDMRMLTNGDATLSSAERKSGFLLLQRGSGPSKSWSVKVTVSGPAPAARR